jgi:hypothetical protein
MKDEIMQEAETYNPITFFFSDMATRLASPFLRFAARSPDLIG